MYTPHTHSLTPTCTEISSKRHRAPSPEAKPDRPRSGTFRRQFHHFGALYSGAISAAGSGSGGALSPSLDLAAVAAATNNTNVNVAATSAPRFNAGDIRAMYLTALAAHGFAFVELYPYAYLSLSLTHTRAMNGRNTHGDSVSWLSCGRRCCSVGSQSTWE